MACFAVVLLLLLIFILQNSRTVEVSYFGAHGHLRATARRHRHADAHLPGTAQPSAPATPSDRA